MEREGLAIVAGVAGDETDDPLAQAFGRFARNPGNDVEALLACLKRTYVELTPDDLAKITAAVLVVAGDKDPLAGNPATLAAAIPNGESKSLKNVDHLATASDFGFIDAALQFLEVSRPRTASRRRRRCRACPCPCPCHGSRQRRRH